MDNDEQRDYQEEQYWKNWCPECGTSPCSGLCGRQRTEYHVSVSNTFEATSPEDAVVQMAEWLSEVARQAGYRVEWVDDNGPHSDFFDAEKIY